MDSSISGDPGAPDTDFDEAKTNRWKRLGASPDEIQLLRSVRVDNVADADLAEHLDHLRGVGPQPGQAEVPAPDEDPTDPEVAARQRYDAVHGEWQQGGSITVDGTAHRLFNLAHGYVAALVGDERNGIHIVAKDIDELESKIKRLTRVRIWQANKSVADAKARATA